MTTATATAAVTSSTPSSTKNARWVLDASHSHVGFAVRHMMISNVRGEFQKVSAEASFDPASPETGTLSATIEVASIFTRDETRDGHLRSADFFDAENHPTLTFVSKRVSKRAGGLDVVGDITIRGTTKEITLAVDDVTAAHLDPWGNTRIGAVGKAKLSRADFGMRWNNAIEAGGVLVGDEVTITIEAELIQQK